MQFRSLSTRLTQALTLLLLLWCAGLLNLIYEASKDGSFSNWTSILDQQIQQIQQIPRRPGPRAMPPRDIISASKKDFFKPDSSGTAFIAEKIRTFPQSEIVFGIEGNRLKTCVNATMRADRKRKCRKWGVLTTINAPSEAVRRFLYR